MKNFFKVLYSFAQRTLSAIKKNLHSFSLRRGANFGVSHLFFILHKKLDCQRVRIDIYLGLSLLGIRKNLESLLCAQ